MTILDLAVMRAILIAAPAWIFPTPVTIAMTRKVGIFASYQMLHSQQNVTFRNLFIASVNNFIE